MRVIYVVLVVIIQHINRSIISCVNVPVYYHSIALSISRHAYKTSALKSFVFLGSLLIAAQACHKIQNSVSQLQLIFLSTTKPISEGSSECHLSSKLLFVGVILILGGCVSLSLDSANTAQLADTATTGAGIASGLQEANPIMAPMANGGPVGLAIMAGIKLGFNQIGQHQDPQICREWLSMSAAAGWAAAASNIAMMMAPPLAIVALPVLFQTYKSAHNGSSLNTCYMGMMADVILRVPQHTKLSAMPPELREDLLTVVGIWPDSEIMAGTRPVEGTKLVHALMIDKLARIEQFIEHYGLDWDVIGMQDQEGNDIVPLKLAILDMHMSKVQKVQLDRKKHRTTIYKQDGSVWDTASDTRLVSSQ